MTPHNPDNLSPETIGPGYRLLNEDEIIGGRPHKEIELWETESEVWTPKSCGASLEITYRTKLPPVALRALRNSTSLPTSPCHPEPNLIYLPTWFLYFMTISSAISLFFLIYLFLHL